MTPRKIAPLHGSPRANRGVILIISLIVLVAMTLGGIAIMRSVDTTTLIAGNLAFKQRAMHATDVGIAEAMAFLLANKGILANDSAANGYYSSQDFDWKSASEWSSKKKTVTGGTDAAGNTVSYVINRMCTCANTPYNGLCVGTGVANQCGIDNPTANASTVPPPVEGDTYRVGGTVFPSSGSIYYRVTVWSRGPRNTDSYIQAMLTISI